MKAGLVVAAIAALTVVGAKTVGESEQPPSIAEVQAQNDAAAGCWSEDDMRGDRFTLRGAQGSITKFEADKVEGCRFNVSIGYTTASGESRSLSYVAEFVAGESPTFIRYNAPP